MITKLICVTLALLQLLNINLPGGTQEEGMSVSAETLQAYNRLIFVNPEMVCRVGKLQERSRL